MRPLLSSGLFRHLAYWIVFVMFFTFVWGTYDGEYFRNFIVQLFGLPARLALVYITLGYLFPTFLVRRRYSMFAGMYLIVLVGTGVLIQRPVMYFIVQPVYLPGWESSHFFAITELMNTILDVNLAAIFPIGYTLFVGLRNDKPEQIQTGEESYFFVRVDKSMQKVVFDEVLYVEALKNYIKIKLKEGELIAYRSFTSIEQELPRNQFLRVHRSFIVNKKAIDSISAGKVVLNGHSIPVGRKFRDEVKTALGYS